MRYVSPNFKQDETNHYFWSQPPFCSNKLKSTKYTWLTFLPITLMKQLKNVILSFYLITGTLQTFPQFTVNPPELTFWPWAFIVMANLSQEFSTDWIRSRSDAKANRQKVTRLTGADTMHSIASQDVRVGDVIKLGPDQEVPADCLVLEIQANKCYASIQSLDGEIGFKIKSAPEIPELMAKVWKGQVVVDCMEPEPSLFVINGVIKASSNKPLKIKVSNFLHRSSLISHKVIALVLYTGKDTKLALNQGRYNTKLSKFSVLLNQLSFFAFLALAFLIFGSYFMSLSWNKSNINDHYYIFPDAED